jgi:hypothetical protein
VPRGPISLIAGRQEAESVWRAIALWLTAGEAEPEKRAVILRFHRFFPGLPQPVVSHWTTAFAVIDDKLLLHDASSEPGALLELERAVLAPAVGERSLVRIVPESLVFIRK